VCNGLKVIFKKIKIKTENLFSKNLKIRKKSIFLKNENKLDFFKKEIYFYQNI